MENNRLISMTDFVLSESQCAPISAIQFTDRVCKYANFLKQPLTLVMFVPVDENGNVLSNPWATDNDAGTEKEYAQIAYNKAKEAVLFEGFVGCNRGDKNCVVCNNEHYHLLFDKGKNVEYLIHEDLTLTTTALKTIYG